MIPRWSEENLPKNLVLVDKMKRIANRLGITVGQLTLAWILAQDPHCTYSSYQLVDLGL